MRHNYQSSTEIEAERIRTLKKYDILDTPPDGSFDKMVHLAAKMLDMPIVIISLVDTDRIWFKSHYGLEIAEIDREPGLCSSAIMSDEVYIIEDAVKDPRSLANPLVAGEFGLRFYAASPLKTIDGYNLGTFCIIDKKPRILTEAKKEILNDLAAIVMDQMELRLAARIANSHQNQLLTIAAHDLRNPLSTISMRAELIKEEVNSSEPISEMCDQIIVTSARMNRIIQELLDSSGKEAGKILLNTKKIKFAEIIKRVASVNQTLANNKNQRIQLEIEDDPFILGDENKVFEIVDNLINNAIKYSRDNKKIKIFVKEISGNAIMEVVDEGQGFTEEDKKYLFQRFTRLSAQPTGGESATGLGLSIVKMLVEAHHGSVSVESDGHDKGSKFKVEIPAIAEM